MIPAMETKLDRVKARAREELRELRLQMFEHWQEVDQNDQVAGTLMGILHSISKIEGVIENLVEIATSCEEPSVGDVAEAEPSDVRAPDADQVTDIRGMVQTLASKARAQ